MIRAGKKKDLSQIVLMAKEFWTHTSYDEEFEPQMVKKMAKHCIANNLMAVVEIDNKVVGFACGIKGPLLANSAVSAGTEIAWWVDPEYRNNQNGVELLKFLEQQARLEGIKYWNMIYMQSCMPEIVQGIYEKMGYTKTEVSYTKVL